MSSADPIPRGATTVVANEQADVAIDEAAVARLASEVLRVLGVAELVELSVVFVDEATIANLNSRYRGREGPTDVLSFAIDEPDQGALEAPRRPEDGQLRPSLLGDVVICPAVAARAAASHAGDRGGQHRGEVGDEVALLLIHGILHIRGYDHEADEDAEQMEAREAELLARYRELCSAEGLEVAKLR